MFSLSEVVGLFQNERWGKQEKVEGIVYKVINDEIIVAFESDEIEKSEFDQMKPPLSLV